MEGSNTFNYTRESDAIDGAVLFVGAASYTQSSQGLVAENRGGTSSYYHSDVLGTTRSLTSSTQTKTDTFQFDAFGLSTGRTGTNATPFGFVGGKGYQADSSGLMLLGHRLYDGSTGRFLSRDPIQDGDNWYIYCNNDPVNAIDPTGNFLTLVAVGALVALGVVIIIAIRYGQDHPIELPTITWSGPPEIVIDKTKYPETAQHVEDSQAAGHPSEVTIDRSGSDDRRKDSLRPYPTQPGQDRDEYPPAVTQEGGTGADVRYISPSDNRGAGSSMGHQMRPYPNGTKVKIVVR